MLSLTRRADWDRRLPRVIAQHRDAAPAWGVSDCWTLMLDGVEAVTGEKIFPKLRRYKSEAGGYRLFAKLGFSTVEDALASAFEPVGVLSAQRGDVGVIEREGLISCGVFDAEGLAVKTLYGNGKTILRGDLRHFPVTQVKTAFKVARD